MKHKTRKLLSIFLALVMVAGLLPLGQVAFAAQTDGGNRTPTDVYSNKHPVYTVTFDANGHGEAPEAVTVNEGETITEPKSPPSSRGFAKI